MGPWGFGSLHSFSIVVTACLQTGPRCRASVVNVSGRGSSPNPLPQQSKFKEKTFSCLPSVCGGRQALMELMACCSQRTEVFPLSYANTTSVPEVGPRCSRDGTKELPGSSGKTTGVPEVGPRCSPFPMEKRLVSLRWDRGVPEVFPVS